MEGVLRNMPIPSVKWVLRNMPTLNRHDIHSNTITRLVMDGQSVLCTIADVINHQEPTLVVISIQTATKLRREAPLDTVEFVLKQRASKGGEIGHCSSLCFAPAPQPTHARPAIRCTAQHVRPLRPRAPALRGVARQSLFCVYSAP